MANNSLSNTKINITYASLLHANGVPIPTAGQEDIYDGAGNKSSLKLGRACNGATVCGTFTCDTLSAGNLSTPGNLTVSNLSPYINLLETDTTTSWFFVANNSTFDIRKDSITGLRPFSIAYSTGNTTLNYGLSVTGAVGIGGAVTAPSFNATSSIRYKEDLKPIENALDIIKKLEGVTFTWKSTGKRDTGLIAEEVVKVAPDFVLKDENNMPLAIDYGRITSVLIEAIKELAILVQSK